MQSVKWPLLPKGRCPKIKSIFAFNLRNRFFPDMLFLQNHKGHYGAWFKPKKFTHQWTIFLENSKKPYFGGVLGHSPKNKIFSKKSHSISFLPLRHPNFMRSFRKILWAVLGKTCLPADILTYWQWWNHMTPFRLKARVQKQFEVYLLDKMRLKIAN